MMDSSKNVEKIIKKYNIQTDAQTENRILGDALEKLNEIKVQSETHKKKDFLHYVIPLNPARLATAAIILVVSGLWIYFYYNFISFEGVALANVINNVDKVERFTFRQRMDRIDKPFDNLLDYETILYYSPDCGIRLGNYLGGKIDSRSFLMPADNVMVTVVPNQKKYIRKPLTDEDVGQICHKNDPRELIKQFIMSEHIELGKATIDGFEAYGIEVENPQITSDMLTNAKGRLWINIENELPVKMELEGYTYDGTNRVSIIIDEFRWKADLNEYDLGPIIPEDYSPGDEDEIIDNMEKRAINGFRTFSEIAGGKYPASLSVTSLINEAGNYMKIKGLSNEKEEKLLSISAISHFYFMLLNKYQEVEYNENITHEDLSKKILLQWKITDKQYRIIYSDLSVENVIF